MVIYIRTLNHVSNLFLEFSKQTTFKVEDDSTQMGELYNREGNKKISMSNVYEKKENIIFGFFFFQIGSNVFNHALQAFYRKNNVIKKFIYLHIKRDFQFRNFITFSNRANPGKFNNFYVCCNNAKVGSSSLNFDFIEFLAF